MKKINALFPRAAVKALLLCGLVMSAALPGFAQQEKRLGDFEIFGGMPFFYERLENEGRETLRDELPFSFGFSAANYNFLPGGNVGINVITSLVFPKTIIHTHSGGEDRYAGSDKFVWDAQVGGGWRIINHDRFKLPISFGFHFIFLGGTDRQSDSVTTEFFKAAYGIGMSAAVEFHNSEYSYFFVRARGFLDFVSITSRVKYTGVSVFSKMAYFIDGGDYTRPSFFAGISPSIGIGIKLDPFVSP
jgi:hypothetical protein